MSQLLPAGYHDDESDGQVDLYDTFDFGFNVSKSFVYNF